MSTTSQKPKPKAAVPLTGYQRDWVKDVSRYKLAVKARRIGFTFATTLEIALDCASRRTRWLIISRTQDTAKEAIREIRNHLAAMRLVEEGGTGLQPVETGSGLFFEGVEVHKFVIEMPNGSEITALTAHPDAARGFGGNVFLDEFGFHRDSRELWKGASASTLRGHRLLVVSTPHYQQGKYFELAREAGCTTGMPPAGRRRGIWSCHWADINLAAPQLAKIGVPIDLDELRALAGDEEAWQQEFCCQFLSAAEMWISLELIAAARSPGACAEWDPERPVEGWLYPGFDIGRRRDLFCVYLRELIGDVAFCRGVIRMRGATFAQMFAVLDAIFSHPRVRRGCGDATGLGMQLCEQLAEKHGSKVEGVTFTGERKEAMSVILRKRFEERLEKIPENDPALERAIGAVKREVTASGNLRFDAVRTDAGHADEYWAQALSCLASDSGVPAAMAVPSDSDVPAWREYRRPSIWGEAGDRRLETGGAEDEQVPAGIRGIRGIENPERRLFG
jgi:phage FluMu gp28-like protein